MSENLEKNVKQIAELLSQDDVADNLKKLLGSLLSSKSEQEKKPKESGFSQSSSDGGSKGDMRTIENIVRAVTELRDANDPGVNLLMALKPFLRQRRSKALNDCVKILHMARIYEYIKEHEDTSGI